ncbi:hypothetical protein AMTRI_Chr09g39000 [Amborella trichopoda]
MNHTSCPSLGPIPPHIGKHQPSPHQSENFFLSPPVLPYSLYSLSLFFSLSALFFYALALFFFITLCLSSLSLSISGIFIIVSCCLAHFRAIPQKKNSIWHIVCAGTL